MRKRKRDNTYNLAINREKNGTKGMSLENLLSKTTSPQVKQMVNANLPSDNSVFIANMPDIDSTAAVAVANIRRKKMLSDTMLERINFLAGIVEEKKKGWCPKQLPTEESIWSSEEERFLYAFHLSHNKEPRRLVSLIERWIQSGSIFKEMTLADNSRRYVITDTKKLSVIKRRSGIVYLRVKHSKVPIRDYFDQVLFFGFNLAPVSIIQSELVPELFTPIHALTVASYDERYFDFPGFLKEALSITEYVRIPVSIEILKPVIDVQTLREIPPKHFEEVIKTAERHYHPPQ